jgi:uncharacterized protein UPF0158
MAALVSLKEVVDAIELQTDDSETYLDPETGELIFVTEDERTAIEENLPENEIPERQREVLPKAREALENDRYLILPDKRDVHEWSIMEEFAREQSGNTAQLLRDAIHGSGAFRKFRAALDRLGLEQAWYKFRAEQIEQIARDWLEVHKLHYK